MLRRGFTIVELIITITIMGILLVLAVVAVGSTQAQARDDERKADVDAIGLNLESFFRNGVSSTGSIPTITNLLTNPSAETNTTSWYAFFTNLAQSSTFAKYGTQSLRNTSPGTAVHGVATDLTVATGTTYTFSAWVYRPASSQSVNFKILLAGAAYANIQSTPTTIPADTWTRLSVSASPTASGTASFIILTDQVTTGSGHVFYVDSAMVTTSSTLYDYKDGSITGWAWNGTQNASTSSGTAITIGAPGTYPSVSLTYSPLITTYLTDADLKSFTAPGQTDPYASFISATNNIQTAAGVTPQPTTSQYVYQPIDSNGSLCYNSDCRKYNIYYRTEKDNTVNMVTSKSQ